jgi:hypothetical protein
MDKYEQDLVWKLIDGEISDDELMILEGRFEDDEELRRYYQSCMETEQALGQVAAATGFESQSRVSLARYRWVQMVAGIVILLGLGGLIGMQIGPSKVQRQLVKEVESIELVEGVRFTPVRGMGEQMQAYDVACIEGVSSLDGELILPKSLTAGVLEIDQGRLDLVYQSGTRLSLLGPVRYELIDGESAWLHEGTLAMVKEGDRSFTVFHEQGRVVDVGTSFMMKVDGGNSLDVYVRDGTVDVYDKKRLRMHRLEEGASLSNGGDSSAREEGGKPAWVAAISPEIERISELEKTKQFDVQTTTWLDGQAGSGHASGSLNGVGVILKGPASANGGGLYVVKWAEYLPVMQAAGKWYHEESAAIGCQRESREQVVVEFDADVEDPILLFGWGESDLDLDLSNLSIHEGGFFPAYEGIRLTEKGVLEFSKQPEIQNRPSHAAALRIKGVFGPKRPLVFHLDNRLDRAESVAFSLALVDESSVGNP